VKEKVFIVSSLHVVLLLALISFYPAEVAEAQSLNPSDLAGGENDTTSDMDPSDLAGGEQQLVAPSDLAGDDKFLLNTQKIAKELSSLSTDETSQYPLTSLSADDIESVFGFLNQYDLTRLLLNIPQDKLVEVKNMLDPLAFNQTINNLAEENRTQVVNRLNSTLP
jgi:hypothetical protein